MSDETAKATVVVVKSVQAKQVMGGDLDGRAFIEVAFTVPGEEKDDECTILIPPEQAMAFAVEAAQAATDVQRFLTIEPDKESPDV